MINVYLNAKDGVVKVTGHANYAPKGQDIVCAGVSSIVNGMYTYFCDVKKIEEYSKMNFVTEIKYESGLFDVKFNAKNVTNIIALYIFSKMFKQFEDNEYIDLDIVMFDDGKVS